MSRRSVTTIIVSVKLRIPPGSSTIETMDFITRALREGNTREIKHTGNSGEIYSQIDPVRPFDTDSMIVKLEKKETVYL